MKLQGKVSVVTGASKGLGRAIALGLAKEGSKLVVNYNGSPDAAEEVAAKIRETGGEAIVCKADTSSKREVDQLFRTAIDTYGKIDVLVNNAGIAFNTPFLEIPEEEWDKLIGINVKGYFLCGQAAAKWMAQQGTGGKIINISSTRQVQSHPGNVHYCTSKGAIYMMTRCMALELAPLGIHVNSIAPGTIPTNLNPAMNDPEFREKRVTQIPVGRLGVPEDLVGAAVLLASSESDFMSGASIMIDGGQTLW